MKTAAHVVAIGLVVIGLLWACRFVYRGSRLAGLVFAAGLAARVFAGGFFLAVSYFSLPVLTHLQMGNGFWTLASDAQEYYRLSSLVAAQWQETITPGYVGPMGWWMRIVGVHPASPVLFALVMHALGVVAIVAVFGRNRTRGAQQALDFCVAAFSFSPMLVYACVFGLKDVYSTTLIVLLAAAYLTLLDTPWTRATLTTTVAAATVAAISLWYSGGTRAYFAILIWIAMAVTSALCVIAKIPSRRRAVVQAAVVLPVAGLVVAFGAEGNYPKFLKRIAVSVPTALVERKAPLAHGGIDELDARRKAIDNYGGDSMIASPRPRKAPARPESAPPPLPEGRPAPEPSVSPAPAPPESSARPSRVTAVAIGLGAVFVPVSLLERLSIIDLNIGTLARLIADADTLFLDVTALAALWLLFVNRARLATVPVIFAATLTVVVAFPLAYVMTNYGTLIRLRLMVAAPIWLLALALAPRFRAALDPLPTSSRADTSAPSGER